MASTQKPKKLGTFTPLVDQPHAHFIVIIIGANRLTGLHNSYPRTIAALNVLLKLVHL